MKKTLILPECEWILADEAKNDKTLNPTDKNVLTVLQYMADNTGISEDGFFDVFINKSDKVKNTLLQTLEEMGFKADYTTVMRSINKLWRFRYIDYKKGFYNNKTNVGKWPQFRIMKGTITITDVITDTCSDIAILKGDTENTGNCNNKITDDVSDTCSDIATTYTILNTKTNTKTNTIAKGTYSSKCEKSDFNECDLGHVEDTSYFGGEVTPIGIAEHPKSELDFTLGQIEWGIENDVWASDVAFDLAFDKLKRKVDGLDLNYDYLKKLYTKRNRKLEHDRMMAICVGA